MGKQIISKIIFSVFVAINFHCQIPVFYNTLVSAWCVEVINQVNLTSASAAISYFDFLPGLVLMSSSNSSSLMILVPKLSAWGRHYSYNNILH